MSEFRHWRCLSFVTGVVSPSQVAAILFGWKADDIKGKAGKSSFALPVRPLDGILRESASPAQSPAPSPANRPAPSPKVSPALAPIEGRPERGKRERSARSANSAEKKAESRAGRAAAGESRRAAGGGGADGGGGDDEGMWLISCSSEVLISSYPKFIYVRELNYALIRRVALLMLIRSSNKLHHIRP